MESLKSLKNHCWATETTAAGEVSREQVKAQAPEDSYASGGDSGRGRRIGNFIAHQACNAADIVRTASTFFIGEAVGMAVGGAIIGGPVGSAVGGMIGAVAALLADESGAFGSTAKAVHGLASKAALKLANAGSHLAGGARTSGCPLYSETVPAGEAASQGNPFAGKMASLLAVPAHVLKAVPRFVYPSLKNATSAEKALILDTLDSLPLKDVTSVGSITISDTLASSLGAAGTAQSQIYRNAIVFDRGQLAMPGWGKNVIIHEVGHTRDFSETLAPLSGESGYLSRIGKGPWGKGPYVTTYASTNHFEDFAESHAAFHQAPERLQSINGAKFDAMQNVHGPGLYEKIMERPEIREAGKAAAEAIDKVPFLRETLQVAGTIVGPLALRHGSQELRNGIQEDDPSARAAGKMTLAQGVGMTTGAGAPLALGLMGLRVVIDRRVKAGRMSIETAESLADRSLAIMAGPAGMIAYAALQEMVGPFGGDSGKGAAPAHENAKLTAADKAFMVKVTGGALLGGIAGTIAGSEAGAVAGAVLGAAAGGPLGAAVGAFLGRSAGILAVSYTGAMAGAKAGKALS